MVPYSWMDAIHQGLGMGKLPDAPIVGYLVRSGHAKSASRPPAVTVSDSGDYDQAIGNPHKSWERDRPDDSQGRVVRQARRQEGNGTKSLSGVERQRSPDESRDRTKPVPPRQP